MVANRPIVGGMSGDKPMSEVGRNKTHFDFDTPGEYVRANSRPGLGPMVVHDTRCKYVPEHARRVPVDDIGERLTIDDRVQVCCTYCVRMGWLWVW